MGEAKRRKDEIDKIKSYKCDGWDEDLRQWNCLVCYGKEPGVRDKGLHDFYAVELENAIKNHHVACECHLCKFDSVAAAHVDRYYENHWHDSSDYSNEAETCRECIRTWGSDLESYFNALPPTLECPDCSFLISTDESLGWTLMRVGVHIDTSENPHPLLLQWRESAVDKVVSQMSYELTTGDMPIAIRMELP